MPENHTPRGAELTRADQVTIIAVGIAVLLITALLVIVLF